MSQYVLESNDNNFEQDVLNSELPVLVDFNAEWCGPCRSIKPHIENLAQAYNGRVRVVSVNTDRSPQVTQHYGVQGIPALFLFQNGEMQEKIVGAVPKAKIEALMAKYVGQGQTRPSPAVLSGNDNLDDIVKRRGA